MKKIIVYTDGASRGNPGPASLGVFIQDGDITKKYSEYLGEITNNEAEYQALIFALKKIKLLFGKDKVKNLEIEVRSDSQLLMRQMRGEYKIIEENIQKLFLITWNIRTDFGKIDFVEIPREENGLADQLANEALDNYKKAQKLAI